jgi:hypothetical protein
VLALLALRLQRGRVRHVFENMSLLPAKNAQSLPLPLLRLLLAAVCADRAASVRQRRSGAEAASWAAAAAALVRAVSAADASFAATLALPRPPGHARGVSLLSAAVNLRTLTLRGAACDASVAAAATLPQLTRLDVSHSPRVTAASGAALASGAAARRLAALLAAGCARVDDAFVASVASLRELRYLDLSATAVSDVALSHLTRAAPPLAVLRLSRCAAVQGRPGGACWADVLADALPCLTCLDVTGTNNCLVYEYECAAAQRGGRSSAAPLRVPALGAAPRAAALLWRGGGGAAAAPPSPDAAVMDEIAARRLPVAEELRERRVRARAWGGPALATLLAAVADAALAAPLDVGGGSGGGSGKRARTHDAAGAAAGWACGAKRAARTAPWARAVDWAEQPGAEQG